MYIRILNPYMCCNFNFVSVSEIPSLRNLYHGVPYCKVVRVISWHLLVIKEIFRAKLKHLKFYFLIPDFCSNVVPYLCTHLFPQ